MGAALAPPPRAAPSRAAGGRRRRPPRRRARRRGRSGGGRRGRGRGRPPRGLIPLRTPMLRPVGHFAVAAIGRDRPGIVAAVTRNLVDHQLNVEDSQMTILGGHFTMMLIVSGDDGVEIGALRADLEATARELSLEAISVETVADTARATAAPTHTVTVYGVDHPGIVHAVSTAL